MALHDYRRLVDVRHPVAGAVTVELEDRIVRLGVSTGDGDCEVWLDEGTAGTVLDAIAGALRVLAAPAGNHSKHREDQGGSAWPSNR